MQAYERRSLREKLDEALLPFRLVGKRKGRVKDGWLLSIRRATGIPVDELARRMGVCRWEVHRMERSEQNERIMLATLRRAAEGLGCDLVYALVPQKGTLAELGAACDEKHKKVLKKKREERLAARQPWLEAIGWREKMQNALRTALRRDGYRVRPRKTNRGVEKQKAEFKETMKLAGMADVMGPLMSKLASQRVGEAAGDGGKVKS